MANSLVAHFRRRVYAHRSRWTARKLMPFLKSTDRILDVGAGDCRLDVLLHKKIGCEVVPVDVEDFNQTDLPMTLFDGKKLPFADDSFDVVLLVFVLHHAEDAKAVLEEARRVSRDRVIVFEDVTSNLWDRMMFRGFHHWLAWSEKISYPFREFRPSDWTGLASSIGLKEDWSGIVGRQLGAFGCRHVVFVWKKSGEK